MVLFLRTWTRFTIGRSVVASSGTVPDPFAS
jgi:hypothetical protein